ncbi:nitroreductase family deazaflavin-dependent oxidoreductase [Microtetraspora malaysiensis]|uniref:nitroreductase family deazaflavin-dependent oxidoreductase n=1 Tax=Microtetraspora malaysiensis TaxID=161358 RepID=UPI003D8D90D2
MTEHRPGPSEFNRQVIEEFRANGGSVGGMFQGATLMLLTTTGARSGRPRTNPVVYLRDRDRIFVFGSNAGRPKNPDWHHNLLADPRCTVEIGTGDGQIATYAATAEPVEGAERDRIYDIQCRRDPAFTAYQAGTSRTIPVIALTRAAPGAGEERNQAIARFLVRVHDDLRGPRRDPRRGRRLLRGTTRQRAGRAVRLRATASGPEARPALPALLRRAPRPSHQ